jgi:transposase
MSGNPGVAESIASRYAVLRPHLDERQRRLLLGVEAQQLGRGGIKTIAEATGVHPDTVARGVRELDGRPEPSARVRAAGGGRKKLAQSDPGLAVELSALVDPETRGDPMSLLVWTTKSTRKLAGALTEAGHPVSERTVARMLRAMGFSLQGNAKVIEGRQHEDRDAQFRYLNGCVREHVDAGQPVISVDAKKKELVGEFKNGGREYQPAGQPERVNVHDFADKELGKAIPYGIYDISANAGWVSVGTDHDTSAFAVQTLRRWWEGIGGHRYPQAHQLLICADGGGSNGYRIRAWKIELAKLAAETGLSITVCHLPPGTSKWNKIEHRLFSQITMNGRGRPLQTHQIIVDLIGNTTTTTGLTVHCVLDTDQYPTGIKYTMKDVDALPITRHDFHGEWNYTVQPATRPQ